MVVFLNGKFLPEADAVVPISDRGLLYGDGLFETIRVGKGRLLWWDEHLVRLQAGASYLAIKVPWNANALREFAEQLIQRNGSSDAVLRLTLTRGRGSRGYSPPPASAQHPTICMGLHELPDHNDSVRLVTASSRLMANDPLTRFKTANKLAQVLGRLEAEKRGADEALLLNSEGRIATAAAGNIFWLKGDGVATPPLEDGALPGVTRGVLMDLCRTRQQPVVEQSLDMQELQTADGMFITNSIAGVLPVSEVDGRTLKVGAVIEKLRSVYEGMVAERSG